MVVHKNTQLFEAEGDDLAVFWLNTTSMVRQKEVRPKKPTMKNQREKIWGIPDGGCNCIPKKGDSFIKDILSAIQRSCSGGVCWDPGFPRAGFVPSYRRWSKAKTSVKPPPRVPAPRPSEPPNGVSSSYSTRCHKRWSYLDASGGKQWAPSLQHQNIL